jgi:hypothetical protein
MHKVETVGAWSGTFALRSSAGSAFGESRTCGNPYFATFADHAARITANSFRASSPIA